MKYYEIYINKKSIFDLGKGGSTYIIQAKNKAEAYKEAFKYGRRFFKIKSPIVDVKFIPKIMAEELGYTT